MIAAAHLILVVGAALLLWAGSPCLWPFTPCGRCRRDRRQPGSTSRRFGTCRRCGGSRRVQRRGSRIVRRIAWTVRGEVLRELERRRDRKTEERTGHPRSQAREDQERNR